MSLSTFVLDMRHKGVYSAHDNKAFPRATAIAAVRNHNYTRLGSPWEWLSRTKNKQTKDKIMIKQIKSTIGLASVVLGLVIASPQLMGAPPLPGAIFTTDSTCSGVNLNIYTSKGDVYIDGGPAHPGAASLPDGSYYVQVTNPGGDVLLGTSIGSGTDTPFVVVGGEPQACYQLSAILIKASDSTTRATTLPLIRVVSIKFGSALIQILPTTSPRLITSKLKKKL